MADNFSPSGYGAPTNTINVDTRVPAAEDEMNPMGAEFASQPPIAVPQEPVAPQSTSQDYTKTGASKLVKSFDEARAAGEMAAAAEAGYFDAQQRALEDRARTRQAEVEERTRLKEQKMAELQQSRSEELAAEKEAGQGYWENRSVGAKIAAAIAQGLGAYAATMTGTQNFAAQTIDSAVRADAEQKIRKAKLSQDRTTKVAAKYDALLNDLKDESAVQDVILADNYAMAKAELDKMGAKAKSREVQSKYHAARGELDLKISELYGRAAEKAAAAQAKGMETYVPTLKGNATTKEGAAKINELAGETNVATNGIRKLLELSKKTGSSVSPESRQEAETTAALIKAALRVPILGPGTVNDAERAIMDKIVADPTRIFSLDNTNRKALNTLVNRLEVNLSEKAKAYGLNTFTPTTKTIPGKGTYKQIGPNQWQKVE